MSWDLNEPECLSQARLNPDTGLFRIHKAIFEFLRIAPITSPSAHVAMTLLSGLDAHHTSWPDEIADVLERWGKAELTDYKGDEEKGWHTHLSFKDELRCLIASLYSQPSSMAKPGPRVSGSATDEDIARRCAFYAGTDLSQKDIKAGLTRDKDLFLFAVLKNTYLFLNEKKRALIEPQLSGRLIDEYRRRCEDIRRRHKDFDVNPVSAAGRELLEELRQEEGEEISWLEKISVQNERLFARLKRYERAAYWIVLILIGTMYLIVKR
jgi:hypothetical protein